MKFWSGGRERSAKKVDVEYPMSVETARGSVNQLPLQESDGGQTGSRLIVRVSKKSVEALSMYLEDRRGILVTGSGECEVIDRISKQIERCVNRRKNGGKETVLSLEIGDIKALGQIVMRMIVRFPPLVKVLYEITSGDERLVDVRNYCKSVTDDIEGLYQGPIIGESLRNLIPRRFRGNKNG